MERPEIEEHAVVGDGRAAALIDTDGAVGWLCWPRFDSPSLFAGLLDPSGGTFRVRPSGPAAVSRRYLPGTNVLETRFQTGASALRVLDWMPIWPDTRTRGTLAPAHALVRQVDAEGSGLDVEIHFDPRPDYGSESARFEQGPFGLRVESRLGLLALRTDPPLRFRTGRTRLHLRGGQRLVLLLSFTVDAPAVFPPVAEFAAHSLETTCRLWREWAEHTRYDGPWREQVERSALLIRLLAFAPSGAIVAAPTTSLPERVGGALNWDYRYCWVRDAALTVRALQSVGHTGEAEAFASWLVHSSHLTRPRVRVLYDVYGNSPRRERVVSYWRGYRGSRPVRLHNAAAEQLQLDVYGEVIDALALLVRSGRSLNPETAAMLAEFGEFVCRNWDRPDQGIWEPRGAPRHHTFSRVMCWLALERILELHARGELRGIPVKKFVENRALLVEQIRTRAWNPRLGAYASELDGDEMDASLLLMDWHGFERATSSRMRATARRIHRRLSAGPGLLYRYEQSLENGEGAFGICSFWWVEYLARGGGTLREAEEAFSTVVGYANDVGLFAEEIDPRTGRALGNFPQAFTHIGLISAAVAIEERRSEEVSTFGHRPAIDLEAGAPP